MMSSIYNGYVEHTRFRPAFHTLRYPFYVYCLDLDELAELDMDLPLFGYNRVKPISIHDSDYLDSGSGSIREKLLRHLGEGLAARVGRIFLVTQPRYISAVFNPVSFYYCLAEDGSLLCAVAEVNNTYGERHVYALEKRHGSPEGYPAAFLTNKAFHVSPFNAVEGAYVLTFSEIGPEIDIHVDLVRDGDRFFTAQLKGRHMPLSTWSQLRLMVRHPFLPKLTMARIYWEAARLFFLRKLAFHQKPVPTSPMTMRRNPPALAERLYLKIIDGLLGKMVKGRLKMTLPGGDTRSYGHTGAPGPEGGIRINDYSFFSRIALHGEVGLGEAYVEGLWDSDDLPGLLGLLIENRNALQQGYTCFSALSRWNNFRLHCSRPNTISGSRANIEAHYDLGADFYGTFLDETMTYSCGIFLDPADTLEQAQVNKMRAVMDKAHTGRDDHVLEIGCGWGGLAIEAVKATGCSWTGITVSRTQYEYARARVKQEGLEDRITILLEDYRTVRGSFDRIVSVEMLEAVGHEYLGEFFARCEGLLKPDGIVVLQVITVPDRRYDDHRRRPNWIQKHIFPGGVLPSLTALCAAMTAHSHLQVESMENIGMHYAQTLRLWRERFTRSAETLAKMGFDRAFMRKWFYYFSICEAQFRLRVLGDLQLVVTREGNLTLAPSLQGGVS